jgi:hypothetical protein
VLAAGHTVDMLANSAFYGGLLRTLCNDDQPI